MKKFRRSSWRFQTTFHTPLDSLQPFVATILHSLGQVKSATLTIDAVIMEPKKLRAIAPGDELGHDTSVSAETSDEAHRLLVAALSDWVDFLFVPDPKPFVLFADHDEYTTFFANTKSNLNKVASALDKEGFTLVAGYARDSR